MGKLLECVYWPPMINNFHHSTIVILCHIQCLISREKSKPTPEHSMLLISHIIACCYHVSENIYRHVLSPLRFLLSSSPQRSISKPETIRLASRIYKECKEEKIPSQSFIKFSQQTFSYLQDFWGAFKLEYQKKIYKI